jgi:hypothetical protein
MKFETGAHHPSRWLAERLAEVLTLCANKRTLLGASKALPSLSPKAALFARPASR